MVVRLASLIFIALISVAQAKPLLVDDATIATFETRPEAQKLLKKCRAELATPTHAMVDFAPAPHYSATGANADDGKAKAFTSDIRLAYRAALCFRVSGAAEFARKTQAIADAWANTMQSASNEQGRSDVNFNIAQLVVAASWVRGANGWDDAPFSNWLIKVITPLSRSSESNNRANWGNLQDVAIAAYQGNKPELNKAARRWQELVSSEVADDGTLPAEICRSNTSDHCGGADKGVNGIAYTHFALLPAYLSAEILATTGLDVFKNDAGTALQKAFHKAADFTANPAHFPFYASNHGKLNKLDHCAYFAPALTQYTDENAGRVISAGTCKSDYWLLQKLF